MLICGCRNLRLVFIDGRGIPSAGGFGQDTLDALSSLGCASDLTVEGI
jgi:hypothetical protein